jgi:TRAP-type C4-dicarboxylate transport system permease small subunit
LSRWVQTLEKASFAVALVFLVVLAVLILTDVILRSMRIEFYWGSEGGGILLAWLIFFSLPLVSQQKKHISTDFLVAALSPRLRHVIDVAGQILMLVYMVVLAWVCLELTRRNFMSGARAQGILRLPLYFAQAGVTIGIFMMILSQFGVVVRDIGASPGRQETGE